MTNQSSSATRCSDGWVIRGEWEKLTAYFLQGKGTPSFVIGELRMRLGVRFKLMWLLRAMLLDSRRLSATLSIADWIRNPIFYRMKQH
jgi:hypothetical protein